MSITVELSSEEIAQMTRLTNLQDGPRRWPTPPASFCGFVGSGNSAPCPATLTTTTIGSDWNRWNWLKWTSRDRRGSMEDWVFVDTCIWASFFTRPSSREKLAVDDLFAQDRVALVGPVVAEVLRGFRRQEQADWHAAASAQFRAAPRLGPTRDARPARCAGWCFARNATCRRRSPNAPRESWNVGSSPSCHRLRRLSDQLCHGHNPSAKDHESRS